MKSMTLEQRLIQKYAPDSLLFDKALEDHNACIKYVQLLLSTNRATRADFYDQIISQHLAEALLSPVGWVRARAFEIQKQNNKE
jgi:hypothetical protein